MKSEKRNKRHVGDVGEVVLREAPEERSQGRLPLEVLRREVDTS